MSSKRSAFVNRWRTFARRAAQAQSNAILWILYYALFVPIALARSAAGGKPQSGHAAPAWQPRTTRTGDLPSARRQY